MIVSLDHYFIRKEQKRIRPNRGAVHVGIVECVYLIFIKINVGAEVFVGCRNMHVSTTPQKDLVVFLNNFPKIILWLCSKINGIGIPIII